MPLTHTGSVDITSSVQTSMTGAFLRLFPDPMVERNVEAAVPEDVYVLFGSIPGVG